MSEEVTITIKKPSGIRPSKPVAPGKAPDYPHEPNPWLVRSLYSLQELGPALEDFVPLYSELQPVVDALKQLPNMTKLGIRFYTDDDGIIIRTENRNWRQQVEKYRRDHAAWAEANKKYGKEIKQYNKDIKPWLEWDEACKKVQTKE